MNKISLQRMQLKKCNYEMVVNIKTEKSKMVCELLLIGLESLGRGAYVLTSFGLRLTYFI